MNSHDSDYCPSLIVLLWSQCVCPLCLWPPALIQACLPWHLCGGGYCIGQQWINLRLFLPLVGVLLYSHPCPLEEPLCRGEVQALPTCVSHTTVVLLCFGSAIFLYLWPPSPSLRSNWWPCSTWSSPPCWTPSSTHSEKQRWNHHEEVVGQESEFRSRVKTKTWKK